MDGIKLPNYKNLFMLTYDTNNRKLDNITKRALQAKSARNRNANINTCRAIIYIERSTTDYSNLNLKKDEFDKSIKEMLFQLDYCCHYTMIKEVKIARNKYMDLLNGKRRKKIYGRKNIPVLL